jgi:glycosyltransferase involved in cell wall biosynthesis
LGGGIESFVDAAFDAMDGLRVDRTTVALTDASHRRSNLLRKLGMLAGVVSRCLRSNSGELQIVVFHPSLTVIGVVGQWLARSSRPPIIVFYGVDIWRTARWQLRLAKRSSALALTVSDFSAGALAARAGFLATVVPVAVSSDRQRSLAAGSRTRTRDDLREPNILTVFRLRDAKAKGGFELIEAVSAARAQIPTLTLTVAGHGPPTRELSEAVDSCPWVNLVESPTVNELSKLYSSASLFALCTRTAPWEHQEPSGEGLGLVLAEAQLTGLPVVAPVGGGSSATYLDDVTGVRPTDETSGALATVILDVLGDEDTYERLSREALARSPQAFDEHLFSRHWAAILRRAGDKQGGGLQ